jgi:predicted nucleic acid-binding protein
MVIIDTSLIIDHLRQQTPEDTILSQMSLKYPNGELSISTITIQEIFAGKSSSYKKPLGKIATTLSNLTPVEYSIEIARLAGTLARDSKRNLQFADAAIAATTIHYDATLATLNTKDFAGIPHLNLLKLPFLSD